MTGFLFYEPFTGLYVEVEDDGKFRMDVTRFFEDRAGTTISLAEFCEQLGIPGAGSPDVGWLVPEKEDLKVNFHCGIKDEIYPVMEIQISGVIAKDHWLETI